MIFWKLFYTFCKIGIFNFGGGYAMIALIQNEVVEKQAWMTAQEFTDIVAISQMTPGPIGINVATYAGYTAVVNAGYSTCFGIIGSVLASFAVVLLPVLLMIIVTCYLFKHKDNPYVQQILSVLRISVIGLIAAAGLLLATPENFGNISSSPVQFVISLTVLIVVFGLSLRKKANPILLLLCSGLAGFVAYYVLPFFIA